MEKKENIQISEGAIRLQVPFSGLIYRCDMGFPSPFPHSPLHALYFGSGLEGIKGGR
jgi:hypothetical protein